MTTWSISGCGLSPAFWCPAIPTLLRLGDGVNSNDVPTQAVFPFHAPPHAGYLHSQENGTNGRGTVTGQ